VDLRRNDLPTDGRPGEPGTTGGSPYPEVDPRRRREDVRA
jgi:hypothetical protein